ncbi:MAG: ComEA family DNA-binding protein [Halopseudomonas yangmingensis]|uniref:Competence protein ComEA n=1 Tax=Halopseudomonas yangmingensis TaxID=1720063 RepID=A0A1I4STB4_9GAMM|nr:competence protein ComEA [Halopseudomonas yangmingensis]
MSNHLSRTLRAFFLTLFTLLCVPAFAEGTHPSVNINAASAAELAEVLQGVGQAKAEAIVAYRETNGSFTSAQSLADVKGIGAATVERNLQRISLE